MALDPAALGRGRKCGVVLSVDDRKAAYHMLLGMSEEGALARGAIQSVALTSFYG